MFSSIYALSEGMGPVVISGNRAGMAQSEKARLITVELNGNQSR
jgi:hypothetical protein